MATLTGQTILSTYQSLLKIDTNSSLSSTLTAITDGLGNASPLSMSTAISSFTGSVGIGSTSPGAFLEIKAPWNAAYKWLRLVNTNSNAPFDIIPGQVGFDTFGYCFQLNGVTQLVGGSQYTSIGSGLAGNELNSRLGIKGNGSTSTTTVLNIQNSSATELLRVWDDGNVGIGVGGTNAGYKLDVNGSIRAQNSLTVAAGGTVINATSGVIKLQKNGSDFIYINNDSYSLRLLGDQTTIATSLGVSIGSSAYGLVSNYSGYRGVNIRGGWNLNLSDTPVASAILQADSTAKGFLPPRMTNSQRASISSPAIGLIVYCTDAVEGLYIYKSNGWTFVI